MISVKVQGLDLLLTDIVGINRDEKRLEVFRAGVKEPEIVTFLDEETAIAAYQKLHAHLLESDTIFV